MYWQPYQNWQRCGTCGGNGVNNGWTCTTCNGRGGWYVTVQPPTFIPQPLPPIPYRQPYPKWVPQCSCGTTGARGACPVHPNISY